MKNAPIFLDSAFDINSLYSPQCNQGGSDYQKDKDISSESILRMLCTANVHSLFFKRRTKFLSFVFLLSPLNSIELLDEKNHVKVPDTLIQPFDN